jgi:hypothetical protein
MAPSQVTTEEEHLLAAIRETIDEAVAGYEATVREGDGQGVALATFTITSRDASTASLHSVIVSPTEVLVRLVITVLSFARSVATTSPFGRSIPPCFRVGSRLRNG